MLARLSCVLLALALFQQPAPAGRVFLLSLDGMGYQRLTDDPVITEVPTLTALLKSGAHAEGLRGAFPASTADSHAALWTGTYAGRNGILYNSTPLLPRSEHTYSERVSGFLSDSLIAEPIWLAAARQGVPVVAHQVTQVVPFLPQTVGVPRPPGLVVVNGYQSRTFAGWRMVRAGDADVRAVPCEALPARARAAVTCVEWSLGPSTGDQRVRAALLPDRLVIVQAGSATAIEVMRRATEDAPPKSRALARHWSASLPISGLPDDVAARLMFRLFELDATHGTFLLLQSPLAESAVASTDRSLAASMVENTGSMVGNGAGDIYASGGFGAPAFAGGNGEAERRYLETIELVVRQQIAQSTWLFTTQQPRLHISYLSTADEVDHAWYGLDRAGAREFTAFRRWAYMAIEQAVHVFTSLASPADHVVITSDHGMAAVTQGLAIDRVIDQAGLGSIASTAYTCIVLNTTDRKDGTIMSADRDAAVDRVRRALLAVRGPGGMPVVPTVYSTREDMAALGHDGPGGADLCFDLAPGVGIATVSAGTVGAAVFDFDTPRGAHGMDPSRPDMQAMLLVTGPRVRAGENLGPLRSIAVAPLVADLLGIDPPRDAAETSPLSLLSTRSR